MCEFFYSEDILWRLPTLLKRWKMTKRNSFVAPSCLWLTSKPHSGDYYKIFHKELYKNNWGKGSRNDCFIRDFLHTLAILLSSVSCTDTPERAVGLDCGNVSSLSNEMFHRQVHWPIVRRTVMDQKVPKLDPKSKTNIPWSRDSRHIPNSNEIDNWEYLNLHCMIIYNAIRCSHF